MGQTKSIHHLKNDRVVINLRVFPRRGVSTFRLQSILIFTQALLVRSNKKNTKNKA